MGTLTLDRTRDREAPWHWEYSQNDTVRMSDAVIMALVEHGRHAISPRHAELLTRAGFLDRRTGEVTNHGRAVIDAYRELSRQRA